MILYACVPGFYAEVERAADPALRGRPVIVGGDPRKRGLVQAATADARAAGVARDMAVIEALERCPGARALRTNMRRYREASKRLRICFREHAPRVEPAGVEAAYLDAADGDAARALAERLREAVEGGLDWPLVVGIAPVKFVARLAAEQAAEALPAAGPEGGGPRGAVLEVPAGEVGAFLDPLPVDRLPGVGPKTAARLGELGARHVAEVRRLGRAALEEAFGNHGLVILHHAEGRDRAEVRAAPPPRTLSQETTLDEPEVDLLGLRERLEALARRLEAGLRLERLAARRVVVKARYADGEQTTRTRTLERPIASAAELAAVAGDLLALTQAGARPIRGLALALGLLRPPDREAGAREDGQLELFGPGGGG